MRCYRHEGQEAIGVCQHCGHGICTECCEKQEGIARCTPACEPRKIKEANLKAERETNDAFFPFVILMGVGLIAFFIWVLPQCF